MHFGDKKKFLELLQEKKSLRVFLFYTLSSDELSLFATFLFELKFDI